MNNNYEDDYTRKRGQKSSRRPDSRRLAAEGGMMDDFPYGRDRSSRSARETGESQDRSALNGVRRASERDSEGRRPSEGGTSRKRFAGEEGGIYSDRRSPGQDELLIGSGGRRRGSESRGGSSGRGGGEPEDSAGNGRQSAAIRQSVAIRQAVRAEKARKIRRLIIMAVAEVFTLLLICGFGYVARRESLLQRPDIQSKDLVNKELTTEKKEHMKGYWTIAVFGVDSRNGNVLKGTNSDVIMICNINQDTGEVKLASIYRDTYLNTGDSTYTKINNAYASGGPAQAIKAINKNLDLNITDFITFNWKAVAEGINILGGIDDVEITKAEFAYINGFITETVKKTDIGSHHLKKAGVQDLDGIQAVAYGRLRLMDTDFNRTERQRLIISKAFDKAKVADYSVLNNVLVTAVLPNVATNISFGDMTNLALGITKYHLGESTGFPMNLTDVIMGTKGDCVIPQTLESNVVKLHQFLYDKENYEPTETVKKISAKIAADTSKYKNAPKTKNTQSSTEGKVKKTTEADEEIYETDDSGKKIPETRESESTTKPGPVATDGSGNTLESSSGSRPGETKPGESVKPGDALPSESSSASKPEGPTKPGETKPAESNTKPSESVTGPGPTVPPTTEAAKPGETTGSTKPSETVPSTKPAGPTVPPETTKAAGGPTISPAPGESEAANPGPTKGNTNSGPGL